MRFIHSAVILITAGLALASCGGTSEDLSAEPSASVGGETGLSASTLAAAKTSGLLPKDLPLYPGATDVEKQTDGQVVRFRTTADPKDVAKFYGEAMEAKLGNATVTGTAGFYTASHFNPSEPPPMQIVARTEDGSTLVRVGVGGS